MAALINYGGLINLNTIVISGASTPRPRSVPRIQIPRPGPFAWFISKFIITPRVVVADQAHNLASTVPAIEDAPTIDDITIKVVEDPVLAAARIDKRTNKVPRHKKGVFVKSTVDVLKQTFPYAHLEDNVANRAAINQKAVDIMRSHNVRNCDIAKYVPLVVAFMFIPSEAEQEQLDIENAAASLLAIRQYNLRRVHRDTWWNRLAPISFLAKERGRTSIDH